MNDEARKVAKDRAECTQHSVPVGDGVTLGVHEFQPLRSTDAAPLVFVAGWVSVMTGWAPLLEVLVDQRPVYYVETREKPSAVFEKRRPEVIDFAIPRLAEDLIAIARTLDIDGARAAYFGSSMGANAILEGLKGGRLSSRGAFVIGPNATFEIPWWGHALFRTPAVAYKLVKPFVLWYLRHFRVDAKKEPQQMLRYERSLNAAEPMRLKLSARAVVGYRIWPGLETIEVPVAVAYASSDILHGEGQAKGIASKLERGQAVACPSNHYMHSADVARDLGTFLNAL